MSYSVPMSSVNMSLTAEEFITSETARLTFLATYAITDPSVDAKAEVIAAAHKVLDGEWYVTGVQRDESSAGIDTVAYGLAIRVPEAKVATVAQAIKSVNRSGLRFELQTTDYTPTQAQVEEGNRTLRKKIYAKAKEELDILNTETGSSGDDSWIIGSVNFNGVPAMAKTNALRANATFYESAGLANAGGDDDEDGVTQKLVLTASVSFTKKIYNRL